MLSLFPFQALSDVMNTIESERNLIMQLQTNAKRDTEKIQELVKTRYVELWQVLVATAGSPSQNASTCTYTLCEYSSHTIYVHLNTHIQCHMSDYMHNNSFDWIATSVLIFNC